MSLFNHVFVKKPGRSLFNLSHEKKFTGNFGYLYPFLVMDTVPGDTFKLKCEFLVRAAPLIAPVMHRINVKINYFFVPNRLLWEEWEDFITGVNQNSSYVTATQQNPYFVTPQKPFIKWSDLVSAGKTDLFKDGELADFLGFPTFRPNATPDANTSFNIDLLPFYAYNKIYVDWYRNQNVEGGYEGKHTSGNHPNSYGYMSLRRRMWEKDYFTSALPFAQRGDAVDIPVGDVEFVGTGKTLLKDLSGAVPQQLAGGTAKSLYGQFDTDYDPTGAKVLTGTVQNNEEVNIDNSSNLKVNMGTINDLRIATRLQRWLEKNARVGGRYIEQILAHYGIKSSDARLQRAEYLGGYTVPIVVSEVDQTNATVGTNTSGTDTPQGHQAGKGLAYGSSKAIKCFCEEHGFIFGIISILPRTSYQDCFPRMYKRSVKEDYYFPEFANLGEQEVTKDELYFDLTNVNNQSNGRFGFQERYCEYKYIPSTVHGEFKNSLQFWHLGRGPYTAQPVLNYDFVKAEPRNSIFAVTDNSVSDHFYVDIYNNISALRPMPKQAIPTL